MNAVGRCADLCAWETAAMRAVVLRSHGGPEVLTIESVPDPEPGPDEVVIDIAATAVNRADVLQRMGLYPDPRKIQPEIPGLEFSGIVSKLGARAAIINRGLRAIARAIPMRCR